MDTRIQFVIVNRHMAELRNEAAQDRLGRSAQGPRFSRIARLRTDRALDDRTARRAA